MATPRNPIQRTNILGYIIQSRSRKLTAAPTMRNGDVDRLKPVAQIIIRSNALLHVSRLMPPGILGNAPPASTDSITRFRHLCVSQKPDPPQIGYAVSSMAHGPKGSVLHKLPPRCARLYRSYPYRRTFWGSGARRGLKANQAVQDIDG